MRIWLITVGEPLPIDGANERLLRTGILARQLVARGHEVVWWTSNFDHFRKVHRTSRDASVEVERKLRLVLLPSWGYRRNVSVWRLADHHVLARNFRRRARDEPAPDVILSSLPTLELSVEAVRFGRDRDIPVLVDVRDLWPDALLQLIPQWGRRVVRPLMGRMYRAVRTACGSATGILGITEEFVEWGLGHARRDRRTHDAAFPLAYMQHEPPPDELRAAENYWQGLGLGNGKEEFIVCFLGSFGKQVELTGVIRAAKILRAENLPVRFVFCGDGRRLEEYRRQSRGIDAILFPGWVGAAEIWTLMRQSSVGILPYRGTPDFQLSIPNKAIEYFSASLPIVSSLDGVLKRTVTQNRCGWHFSILDADALASLLHDVYDNPREREERGENAHALYTERFVAEDVYARMVDHIERAAAGHRAS